MRKPRKWQSLNNHYLFFLWLYLLTLPQLLLIGGAFVWQCPPPYQLLQPGPPLKPRAPRLPVAVFYNLYVQSESDTQRVSSFFRDQLASLQSNRKEFNPLFINSIGAVADLDQIKLFHDNPLNPDTQFRHFKAGSEVITLHHLWNYCRGNETDHDQLVTYIHSKGSFHSHKENDRLRKYLTKGALSNECRCMAIECNVCSSRMSPLPHPHTPGNMWTARCGYISKLHEPVNFIKKMDGSPQGPPNSTSPRANDNILSMIGRGRFAFEHWVHSHPDTAPCDLDASSRFVWGYTSIPDDFEIELRPAPRYNLIAYQTADRNTRVFGQKQERIAEYKYLYNKLPPPAWFGWKLFEKTNETWEWMLDPLE